MAISEERTQELKETIRLMRKASSNFYSAATGTGNHAFIEFTGLMNEYINVCEMALSQGIDFAFANVHSGEHLPFAPHHFNYLTEKLECIYGKWGTRQLERRAISETESSSAG